MYIYFIIFLAALFLLFFILFLKERQQTHSKIESEKELQVHLKTQISQLKTEKDVHLQKEITLGNQLSEQKAINKSLQQQVTEQQTQQKQIVEQNRLQFEHLSNKILEENSSKFSKQNQENIQQLLLPFKERIKDFEKKIEDTYQHESKERIGLQKEIQQILELNQTLSEQADNLTNALKSDSKAQGNWGEFILTKVLESAGLKEGIHFKNQVTITDNQGNKLRPDVILYLPEERHIIIDSKVSLTAYERHFNANTEIGRQSALKKHLRSIKQHIDELGQKKYERFMEKSPDFVLMFIPTEPAYNLALMADSGLYDYAFRKKVILVSVSSLLATLKIIESIWRLDKQNKNAREIIEEGNKLYDKLVGFVTDMETLGNKLSGADKAYEAAMNKLSEGKGNLIRRADKMKNLGLNPTKQLNTENQKHKS
ncbi:MAG TPA: DNA recombination protein RmuC [Chitinophagaceae bacterium]|nr:DNA recombination protein RmuC [Chitinophagaceae bacterium]